MEWWSRLTGASNAPKKPAPRNPASDPEARLQHFTRVYHTILGVINRPRDIANEGSLLKQLHGLIDRVASTIREETRSPAPHLCLQFTSKNQIYTVIARAATVSQYEPIIQSTVAVFAALVDSEEEDFLSSAPFAKSLMRLITKVVESGAMLISIDTETMILELLFTIAAKIRLQPEILSFWFRSTAKPELEDVFVKEKKSFVGITQKDDFPLCYLLIDRVHHEGRIGDFARTGLLYIFEATGHSMDLEEWLISSDLPTLMASGLGALYSQLSRELSILHPDSTLPAVLAMSDYSTTHLRATAESAFSEKHQNHMATFLSYLAFWQDVLDHCKSGEVKQTLLDHFQILFLQQLLYPSLLQSSDTDAGSSVAVLSYIKATIDSLEYPSLMDMILEYLLAVPPDSDITPATPVTPSKPPRSPTALKRRQSLMLLTAPKNPDDAVEPTLFSLVDLIMNNITSQNSQAVFAALKLSSTILTRQQKFAIGTMLKVSSARRKGVGRTVGALELELDNYISVVMSLHEHTGLDDAYASLVEDVRLSVEAQVPFRTPTSQSADDGAMQVVGRYTITPDDGFLKALRHLLRSFHTNSVDVNLALTQTIIAIVLCIEMRLDGWFAVDPSTYSLPDAPVAPQKRWQVYLDDEETTAISAARTAYICPVWSDHHAPTLLKVLNALALELNVVRETVPHLDQLIAGRKNMLQVTSLNASSPPSLISSPTQSAFFDGTNAMPSNGESRSSSPSSLAEGRKKATFNTSPYTRSLAADTTAEHAQRESSLPKPPAGSIFLPPPPETPSTTDVLMQQITFPNVMSGDGQVTDGEDVGGGERKASLNHVLTNVVVLQEFVLELVAVLQVRAAVLGEREVRLA